MLADNFLLVLVTLHAYDRAVGGRVRGEEDKVLARDSEGDCVVGCE